MASENILPRLTSATAAANHVAVELSRGRERVLTFLLMSVWFGILTGLIGALHLTIRIFLFDQIIGVSRHILWMSPLANALLFGIAGLVLSLISLRWPKIVSHRTAVFLFTFLTFFSLLISYPLIHRYATLILAAGLAAQATRLVSRHAEAFNRLVQRTTWLLAVIVVALGAAILGWEYLNERRALANLPAAAPNAPNVLLITLDTVRAQNLSLHGYGRPTSPELERLSKSGVRFDQAISTSSWTLPSHASMFTGRFDHELSIQWLKSAALPSPTLGETLSRHGYRTGGFVANYSYCTYESDLDRGFAHYEDYKVSPGEILMSSSLGRTILNNNILRRLTGYHDIVGRKNASQLNHDFLRWVSHADQRPFFAFLNYFDAHEPYLPPKPFDTMFGSGQHRRNDLIGNWMREASRDDKESMSPAEIQGEIDAYDGSIAYLDQQLASLFSELEKSGVLKNTVVIITSDHGELFGEHGLFTHANNVYLPTLHVPLLISFPARVPAGKSVVEPVSLRDIPATVLDLLEINDASFPGDSLARYWEGTRTPGTTTTLPMLSELVQDTDLPESTPASKGDSKSLIANGYHYMKMGDGVEELYNIDRDPLETKNLASAQESQEMLARFREALKAMTSR